MSNITTMPLLSAAETEDLAQEMLCLMEDRGIEVSAAVSRHIASLVDEIANPKVAQISEKKSKSVARFSKAAVAAQSIAGFDHDTYLSGLTYGQFSLIDLIQATLDITGPADVTIATWSSGFYDIEAAKNFQEDGRIRSIRFVMDSGRQKKGQAGETDIAELFGEESIITVRTHAKFVLIKNEDWNIIITSSMNLNRNIRTEQFEMTDDVEKFAMFADFVNVTFDEVPPSRSYGRIMPQMKTVDPERSVEAIPDVSRSKKVIAMGNVNLNRDAG